MVADFSAAALGPKGEYASGSFVQPAGGRPLGLIDDSTYDHRPSEVLGTFVDSYS